MRHVHPAPVCASRVSPGAPRGFTGPGREEDKEDTTNGARPLLAKRKAAAMSKDESGHRRHPGGRGVEPGIDGSAVPHPARR